eukprot:TRINITY_DN1744_c0_g1_i1.p3 TRINITY_DN1744_c0_g1~~TRINITY_DN1744_c0_g1_i1.p3  ORF type:complete len:102 (-),score=8.54 TRINITY_DN1744_c0_g1_i1:596-901(-)
MQQQTLVLGQMERTKKELRLLHKFLVQRGGNLTITLKCGKEVCTTYLSLKNIHARRWASSVMKSLQQYRPEVQTQCDRLLVRHNEDIRDLNRCRRVATYLR